MQNQKGIAPIVIIIIIFVLIGVGGYLGWIAYHQAEKRIQELTKEAKEKEERVKKVLPKEEVKPEKIKKKAEEKVEDVAEVAKTPRLIITYREPVTEEDKTITLLPNQDNEIRGYGYGAGWVGENDNRGTCPEVSLGNGKGAFEGPDRFLIKFSLSSIPSGSKILSVDLRLYAFEKKPEALLSGIYKIKRKWREGSRCQADDYEKGAPYWAYSSYPEKWTEPGASNVPEDRDNTNLATSTSIPSTGIWNIEFNREGRKVLEKWINNTEENNGFILIGNEDRGEARNVSFYTSDYTKEM